MIMFGSHARVNFGGASQPRLGRKEPNMIIIGCDYHPGFQQIAFVDTDTGQWNERKLGHREEAEQVYRQLKVRGKKVRVGMEASGHARWFERLLAELHFERWIGAGAVGQPTAARPAGVTGSTDSENPGTDPSSGAGSGEAACGAATDDPSWGGSINRAGVRTGHRNAGALWLRQADRQLCGTGAVRGIQW